MERCGVNLHGKNFHFQWEEDDADTSYKKQTIIPNFSFYKGLYEDKEYGKANIKEENGKAILELLPSKKQFSGYLYYISSNKFKIVFNDRFVPAGYVVFKLDKNKNPTGFKLDINSGDFLFKYLDFKKE